MMLDETHEPSRRSWIDTANDPTSDFPIQNLPFGVFKRPGGHESPRIGVAIGDQILDVAECAAAGLLANCPTSTTECCREAQLNGLMALAPGATRALRRTIGNILDVKSLTASTRADASWLLVPMRDAEMLLPAAIGDYADFYASIEHATNVGSMFRPDNPLLPNYKWVPIGYHGRASSIVVSGTEVRRPLGQTRDGADGPPSFGPSRRLDYELEVGAYVGVGNTLGSAIPIDDAEGHVFGLCLLNDWSARDIQAWEYQPLGPFLAKNFATTVSPWVVTLDALEPFRAPARVRDAGDPEPLPYLCATTDRGAFDITLEVTIASANMRASSVPPLVVSVCGFKEMYWTIAQLLTHHASNGCNLRAGDLLGSGTVSGRTKESRGSLLERAWRGSEPLELPAGEKRAFLADGDEVIFRGYCDRAGARRIGFGECRGIILPSVPTES